MWFYYLIEIFILKKPVKYIQEYIAKLSITDSASVRNFFINSKVYSLQKNLTRVHLWGTFASQRRQVTRVGHCGLSIKINAGIWLVGDTDTPWQWGVHWMETQFWQYFYFLKKEPQRRCSTSNWSWCMGIKGEMSGTVCVTFTWYMYVYELFIAFVCFVVCSLL